MLCTSFVSDGMSRTGVFIAAMCEVERVKVEGEVDIFQTIKAMRKKRPHMVHNKVGPSHTYTGMSLNCAVFHLITFEYGLCSFPPITTSSTL